MAVANTINSLYIMNYGFPFIGGGLDLFVELFNFLLFNFSLSNFVEFFLLNVFEFSTLELRFS